MSAHNDPSTHVPEGSFYNFAYAEPAFCANKPKQYYKDIVLECSSLLTPENMLKMEVAASMLDRAFDVSASDVICIDNVVRQFQQNIGEPLLSELRTGLDYVNRCAVVGEAGSILPVVYNRNLDTRIFWNRMQSCLGMLTSRHPMARPLSGAEMTRVVKSGDTINMSHYASYLSNVAAWMLRLTSPDLGAIHTFSLMLARGNSEDTRRDFDRVNEALAVIAAEHVRSTGFVDNLNNFDCRAPAMKPNYYPLLSHCKWDRKIVSLKRPIDRLLSTTGPGRIGLGDIIPLCVDNRLVMEADTGSVDIDVGKLFVPKLIEFTDIQADVLSKRQRRTKLFPERAPYFILDESSRCGIPMLFARNRLGHPAFLLPADDKCLEFLSKLYSVKLPTPIQPLGSEESLLWAYRFDPQPLMAALRQFGKRLHYTVTNGTFAVPEMMLVRMECMGTNDLATYMEGKISATDMFVNEIMVY